MKGTRSRTLTWILGLLAASLLGACTPDHRYEDAQAVQGPGYPVDCRDMITSAYRPLNNLHLGSEGYADAEWNQLTPVTQPATKQ
jgi:hypothetical protein